MLERGAAFPCRPFTPTLQDGSGWAGERRSHGERRFDRILAGPDEAEPFARNHRGGGEGEFGAFGEASIARTEPELCLGRGSDNRRRLVPLSLAAPAGGEGGPKAIRPHRLHGHAPQMGIAGFRNAAAMHARDRGPLRGRHAGPTPP